MVDRPHPRGARVVRAARVARWGASLSLFGLLACGADAEDAKQVAEATQKTVVRGVGKAKEAIDRVDMDKVRNAWDSTVDAVAGPDASAPAPAPADPLAGAAEAISCDPTFEQCTVTAEFAARARHQGAVVADQVGVHPVREPVRGIRLDVIDTGSIAALLGMRVGDVVTHVNGVYLGSLQDAMMLYMQIRAAQRFTVHYRRGDEERALVIDVVYPEDPSNAQ